jgi:ribonuclease P protein component
VDSTPPDANDNGAAFILSRFDFPVNPSDQPPTPAHDKRYTFPKGKRVRRQLEFDRVYAGKNYLADDTLVVNYARNETASSDEPLGVTRLGLSIGRRVGNAVVRNRWKRKIREAFRLLYAELPTGIDLVVRPRQGAVCDFQKIKSSLRGIGKRIKARLKDTSR